MTGFFARLARFVDDHRRLVLLLVVAALALSAWPLSHARFSGDLTDLLPDDSPAAGAFRKFRERFEQGDNLLVIAVAEPAAPAAGPTPQQWIAALRERVARLPEPLRIEGSIRHPADGEPWEYTVVVSMRNDRGEEIAHKLIGVGAMNPNEQRTFTLSVEAVPAKAKGPWKGGTRH